MFAKSLPERVFCRVLKKYCGWSFVIHNYKEARSKDILFEIVENIPLITALQVARNCRVKKKNPDGAASGF